MRLTLRTLLAYMDDILDPADQEELGRKIESSPFATELIHRSRDAVRRVRLSAPDPLAGSDDDIHGGDHNLDANTAAEYLDNTLSPAAVAEFERSCLEAGPNADMLLAEAASCHHVLTMVLGEPAEVDADLRQRMYALASSPAASPQLRVEPGHAHAAAPAPAEAAAAPAPMPVSTRRVESVAADEPRVPDYMLAAARERRRMQRMIAAGIGAVIVGGGLTWFFMSGEEAKTPSEVAKIGSDEEVNRGATVGGAEGPATVGSTGDAAPVGDMQSGDAESEAPAFTPSPSATPPVDSGLVVAPTLEAPPLNMTTPETTDDVALPPQLPPAAEETAVAASTAESAPAASKPGTTAAIATLPGADPAAAVAGATSSNIPPAEDAPGDAASTAAEAAMATASPTAAAASAGSAVPGATATQELAAAAAAADAAAGPAEIPADAAAVGVVAPAPSAGPGLTEVTPPQAATTAAAQPKPIGAYLGNNDLLLRLDAATNEWVRLAPRSGLSVGDKLLSLPSFRTHVVLADVNAYLSGGAQIELVPSGQPGPGASDFAMHVPYGQVVLNSGLNGNRVELSLVDQTRVVELGPSSSLAIEVRRVFQPGSSGKREPAPAAVSWYLTTGTAKWGDSGSAEAPATWTTAGGEDSAPAAIEALPEWVDREPITSLERSARERIAEAMTPGESVSTRLLELSDPNQRGRRTEDRVLAARAGAYVGQYDAIVTGLGDVTQKSSWREQVDTLRQAIARDPESVESIHAAFALERGPEAADDLMEMLLGFDDAAVGTTRKEVVEGALARLLRWMDNDDLVYRVLASHNANEILGTRDLLGYRPEQSATQRKRMLNRVWERFDRGELLPPGVEQAP